MAQTQIRGSTQILDGSIPLSKLAAGYSVPTGNLAEGAEFIKRGGTVAFTANQSMGGFLLTNVADAVSATDAVNLRVAQALVNGIAIQRARIVATTNQGLSGLAAIDGVTPVAGNIVLLTAQATASQNGPWVAAAGGWTRPSNWAAASTQKSTMWFVEEGTTNHDTKWLAVTDTITVDTTPVTIAQDTSGGTYTNGAGLSLSGGTFAVKVGDGLEFDGSNNVRVKLSGTTLTRDVNGIRISDGSDGQILIANASGVPTYRTITGDVTITNTGGTTINHTTASGFTKYSDFVMNETPAGTINGSNVAFTVATAPVISSLQLYLNGMLLEPGSGNDYTIAGANITMLFAPVTGDKLRAYYIK